MQLKETLDFGSRTYVMGIINVTPDSFSGDGLMNHENVTTAAIHQAKHFINCGADILDVGGESTRPGAKTVDEQEELLRVVPVIKTLREQFSIPISIDTTKASVAKAALQAGADIINDISGLMADPHMIDIALKRECPIILTHNQPMSQIEQKEGIPLSPARDQNIDLATLIAQDLENLALHAISKGVTRKQIIIDPGIGFGKTTTQNLAIISQLQIIKELGYPILLGVSRKSFIGNTTGAPIERRLPGSLAAASIGVLQGVDILRVHDVEETVQAVKVADAIKRGQ